MRLSVVCVVHHLKVVETFAAAAGGPLFIDGVAQEAYPAGPALADAHLTTPITTSLGDAHPNILTGHVARAGTVIWSGASLPALASVVARRRHLYVAPDPPPVGLAPGSGARTRQRVRNRPDRPVLLRRRPGRADELRTHLRDAISPPSSSNTPP